MCGASVWMKSNLFHIQAPVMPYNKFEIIYAKDFSLSQILLRPFFAYLWANRASQNKAWIWILYIKCGKMGEMECSRSVYERWASWFLREKKENQPEKAKKILFRVKKRKIYLFITCAYFPIDQRMSGGRVEFRRFLTLLFVWCESEDSKECANFLSHNTKTRLFSHLATTKERENWKL